MDKFMPVVPGFPHMLHGADYNPDQWKDTPEIIDDDFKFFEEGNVNTASIAIFSWVMLEPEDGVYNFEFFDKIMDKMAAQGMKACFATPSAGKPAWISEIYPDILPVSATGVRARRGNRGGFCKSSPIFRRKIRDLNRALAEHYKDHPALGMWHISNEICGVCYCDRCQKQFREWLKKKYKTLDNLNFAYWGGFWGHTYSNWEQIEAPMTEKSIHNLVLDWYRFTNDLLSDYVAWEAAALKEFTPDVPVTTNFMESTGDLDYKKVAKVIDVVSWDSYPMWHSPSGGHMYSAVKTAFWHDYYRSMSDKPFMLMECTPSMPSWSNVNKLKKPGMHKLAALQAVAHGTDTVQYFQRRKSRGGFEKFHGAVIDHYGKNDTRVFREIAETGAALKKLDEVVGTKTISRAAVMYDVENLWAIEQMAGGRKPKKYEDLCLKFYTPLWKAGISCDVIESTHNLDRYDLVIAPALYMASEETIDKLEAFVKRGGTLISTYMTGWADENDLCHLGGFPGGKLKDVFGIWSEETDTLYDGETNTACLVSVIPGMKKEYVIKEYCDIIHAKGAEVLAKYGSDFFAGTPALTVNNYGKGKAYYVAFKNDGDFMNDLVNVVTKEMGLKSTVDFNLPENTTATMRTDGENDFIFLQNYGDTSAEFAVNSEYFDILGECKAEEKITLPAYGVAVLKRKSK